MKVGDLVCWTKYAVDRGLRDEIGIIINIGWTQNWIWVKWPSCDELALVRRDALATQ